MNILTEEELKQYESLRYNPSIAEVIAKLIASHRHLLSANSELTERNRLLVLENDELNAENEKLKGAIKIMQIILEEPK